jgi:hypothetical protein
MFRFHGRKTEFLAEAHNLATVQLAHLQHHNFKISEEFALSFLAREILRLHVEGERDAQRLATRAIGLLRQHIQKHESASRLADISNQE